MANFLSLCILEIRFVALPNLELYVAKPASQRHTEFRQNFSSKLPGVFEVCSELPSHSKDQFRLLVDEFSELVHTRKSLFSRHLKLLNLWVDPPVRNRIWTKFLIHSVFKVCLELPSGSKEQFGYVVGECSKLEYAILTNELAILLHA